MRARTEPEATQDRASDPVARLRIGRGPWLLDEGRPHWARPRSSFRTDIVIVGAGITGSLAAECLTRLGYRVALVDRLAPGQGSTAASTAMLQWEIDESLVDLSDAYGFEKAAFAYRLSLSAVSGLGDLAATLGIACDWRWRDALMLAAEGDDGRSIEEEATARKRAGLPSAFLRPEALRDRYGIRRTAAAVSRGAATCDPVRLAHGLLAAAVERGAVLIHDEVAAYDSDRRCARVRLAGGFEIEARMLVLATGYEMPPFVSAPPHRMSASWAAATAAGADLSFWRGETLIWEDATPYLYARTTADRRLLVGGEDEAVSDPVERDGLAPAKAAAMHDKLEALWGLKLPPFERVWSAAFGETADGLPLIGPVPGAPNVFAAYGYGGNGITFSYLAARMIAAMIGGKAQPWFDSFALDRPPP